MKIAKNDIPVQIDVPGATARQQKNFGDVTGYGTIGAEFFSFGAGTDITDLLHGLDGNLCQCPHWGFVLSGRLTTTDAEGQQESVAANDLFYWPPGHSVRVGQDAEMILFSPQHEHTPVMDHINRKLNG